MHKLICELRAHLIISGGGISLMNTNTTKFRHIFFNLLSNSYKFTQNGNISLSIEYDTTNFLPITRYKA